MTEKTRVDSKLHELREIHDPRVWRVTELATESLKQNVADLAAKVHLSPSRLSRIFKDEAGIGLGQYLTLLRMRQAALLLETTEEPIKRIAAAVGYNHPSSFVRAFQEHFSESPKSYRRKTHRASRPKYLRLEGLPSPGEMVAPDEENAGPNSASDDFRVS